MSDSPAKRCCLLRHPPLLLSLLSVRPRHLHKVLFPNKSWYGMRISTRRVTFFHSTPRTTEEEIRKRANTAHGPRPASILSAGPGPRPLDLTCNMTVRKGRRDDVWEP